MTSRVSGSVQHPHEGDPDGSHVDRHGRRRPAVRPERPVRRVRRRLARIGRRRLGPTDRSLTGGAGSPGETVPGGGATPPGDVRRQPVMKRRTTTPVRTIAVTAIHASRRPATGAAAYAARRLSQTPTARVTSAAGP